MDLKEEALQVVREAVEMYKALAERTPNAFNPNLAMSLYNLSLYLSSLGLKEEALQAIREAVEMYKVLAGRYPDVFNSNLAGSLRFLSKQIGRFGIGGGCSRCFRCWRWYLRCEQAYKFLFQGLYLCTM